MRRSVRCHRQSVYATMQAMPIRAAATLTLLACLPQAAAAADAVVIPPGIATHGDGRAPIESLYRASLGLVGQGWTAEVIFESAPPGTAVPLPIIALRSPKAGPALWILTGIHGEEPAGPNAVAAAIEDIARLGARRPVVLLPLLNPHGYARNWRYLNTQTITETVPGQSVGDSSHLLPAADNPAQARAPSPSSPEAGAITSWVLRQQAAYPVAVSVDLHEDDVIDAGYVYSQGRSGAEDALAAAAVAVLREAGVPIQMDGETQFHEPIAGGIVGPVTDSSIDELMSAATIIEDSVPRPGPSAETVLVLETPAAALPLERRVAAHTALLRLLADRLTAR